MITVDACRVPDTEEPWLRRNSALSTGSMATLGPGVPSGAPNPGFSVSSYIQRSLDKMFCSIGLQV